MSLNTYGFVDDLYMESKNFEISVSADDKIIQVLDGNVLLASLSMALENNILSLLGKNDQIVAEVELPESQTISNAYYNKETQEIVIEIAMNDGTVSNILIDVSDLIMIYEGHNGIEVIDNKIGIKINEESTKYLSVDDNGLLFNVNSLDDTYATDETLQNYATIDMVDELKDELKNYATNDDISDMATKTWVNEQGFLTEYQDISHKVDWVDISTDENPNRKAIILDNNDMILGKDTNGNTRNLIMVNKWNVVDLGTSTLPINLNTPKGIRPTVQEPNQTGENANQIAYVSDIENLNESINNTYITINQFNEGLDKKADKDYVDAELSEKLDISAYTEDINEINIKIDSKADKDYVDTELDKKADKDHVDSELDKKADKDYVDAELGKKADKDYVDTELSEKLDISAYTEGIKEINIKIDSKADKDYVDAELSEKLDISAYTEDVNEINIKIDSKADKDYVDAELDKKADKDYVDAELSEKLDISAYTEDSTEIITNLDKKADKDYVDSELDKKQNILTAGKNISISGDIISCTLDINLFKVVESLPSSGDPTLIYLVPNDSGVYDNLLNEYIYISNHWEKIGEYKPTTDLSSYVTKDYFNENVPIIVDNKLVNYPTREDVQKECELQANNAVMSAVTQSKEYSNEQDLIIKNQTISYVDSITSANTEAIRLNSQNIVLLDNRCDHFDKLFETITTEHGGETSINVYNKTESDAIFATKTELQELRDLITQLTQRVTELENK